MKFIISIAFAIIFLAGCANQTDIKPKQQDIEKNIVGVWHSVYKKIAKDGIIISTDQTNYYYKNRKVAVDSLTVFRDKNHKILGSFKLKQKGTWSVYGDKIATLFLSCKTRVIKRPKTTKVEFVSDIMKLGCKYANKLYSAKKTSYAKVDYIDNKVLKVRGVRMVKVQSFK